MTTNWYAVKTLYRVAPVGRPKRLDSDYDRGGSLVEERIVAFRARNHAMAITQAEREAKRYAKATHRNAYGQAVVTRYLGHCDSFEMLEPPAQGTEMFSETFRVPLTIGDTAIADRFLGKRDGNEVRLRKCYVDADVVDMARQAAEARQLTTRSTRRTPASRGLRGKPRATGRAR